MWLVPSTSTGDSHPRAAGHVARTPCVRFSLTRLSPRQSTGRIPLATALATGPSDLRGSSTAGRSWPLRDRHLARGPSLRRVMLSTPIIANTASSDFRSALHHFPGLPVIGVATSRSPQAGDLRSLMPGPRRISHVPCRTVRTFRSHYADGSFDAARARSSHLPWPSPMVERLGSRSVPLSRGLLRRLRRIPHRTDRALARRP